MTEHNYKEYTAADFERYYSGQMPEAEMHALEKAALEDPFLADALEGYNYTQTPVKDIAELNEKLFKKKKRNQIFFLQNKVWLRVAASIILFAGIGYMIYELNSPKKFLAKNDIRQVVRSKDSAFVTKSDTNKSDATASTQEVSGLVNEQTADNKKGYFQKPAVKKLQSDSSGSTAYNFSKNESSTLQNETHVVKGRLVDAEMNSIAMSPLNESDKQIAVATDSLRFKLIQKDSSLTAITAGSAYKAKQRSLARNADQSYMLDTANQKLEEIVVTSKGIASPKKDTALLTGKVTGISFNDPNYGPIGGWEKFDQYLSDNISIPVNEKEEKNNTKVVISFEVDKNGDPKKVQIEQSQCNECDKEALRLLQSGPKWKYVSGKKYVIDVRF
jgi:hypothetical protein